MAASLPVCAVVAAYALRQSRLRSAAAVVVEDMLVARTVAIECEHESPHPEL